MVAFVGIRLGPGPDFDTVFARVIEPIGEPMSPEQFGADYCEEIEPGKPDTGHKDNTDAIVLVGDNEKEPEA